MSDVAPHLQSQLVAGVSAIHLGAGQAEPPLEARGPFGQTVAHRAKDVFVHRDGFSAWRKHGKKKSRTDQKKKNRRQGVNTENDNCGEEE